MKIAKDLGKMASTIRIQQLGYGNAYNDVYLGLRRAGSDIVMKKIKIYGDCVVLVDKDYMNVYIKAGVWERYIISYIYGDKVNLITEVSDVDESTLIKL